jgi:hypothetical protein
MKLFIYIILFVILLIYINNHSKKLTKEEFSDGLFDDNNKYQATNPYNLTNINVLKPFPVGDSTEFVVAYNENPSNANEIDNWILSNSDYSDIFNGQDLGGKQIINIMDLPKAKNFLDKAMQNVNNQAQLVNEKPVAEAHKQQIMGEIMPEIKSMQDSNLYPIEITNAGLKYNLLGYVYNTAYRQYYLLYEAINRQINPNLVFREKLDNMNVQVFTYALVKIEKSNPVIKYIFGPRNKININDVVYLSQGPLQIGPLIVDNI